LGLWQWVTLTMQDVVMAWGGLSDSFDGPTHHALYDIAVMRAMPNLTVIVPADAVEAAGLVRAVAEYDGPVYLRISRAEVPTVFDDHHQVTIGKGTMLQDGSDVTLVATGIMVSRAQWAAERLARKGVDARVLALHTVKPLDRGMLLAAAEETGALVTCEEHSVVGGFGGAVAELVSGELPVPIIRVGIPNTLAETGPYEELLDRYGMSAADIEVAAVQALDLKQN
jgi:transketolase